jgi:hypothetical protein
MDDATNKMLKQMEDVDQQISVLLTRRARLRKQVILVIKRRRQRTSRELAAIDELRRLEREPGVHQEDEESIDEVEIDTEEQAKQEKTVNDWMLMETLKPKKWRLTQVLDEFDVLKPGKEVRDTDRDKNADGDVLKARSTIV